MQIEEHNSLVKLFDIYGKLLSERQYDVMDKMLNLDLGESEVAELSGYSRQAVHDAITKAKKQLIVFEETCGVVANQSKCKELLKKTQNMLEKDEISGAKSILNEIINKL